VEVALGLRVERGADGPFRSTGDKNAKGEVIIEETMFDGGEYIFLILLSGTFVKAIDKDSVGEFAGVKTIIRAKSFEWYDNEGIHLSSDGFLKDGRIILDSSADIFSEPRILLAQLKSDSWYDPRKIVSGGVLGREEECGT
jgi:hypothetical protein